MSLGARFGSFTIHTAQFTKAEHLALCNCRTKEGAEQLPNGTETCPRMALIHPEMSWECSALWSALLTVSWALPIACGKTM